MQLRTAYRFGRQKMDEWLAHYYYHWSHRVLFIAGLPKSGTTWMAQLLGAVPGYEVRLPDDPDSCVNDHDVCDAVFSNLPWHRFSVLKLHTRFTPANQRVIERYGLKTVVMYRDLRDQCVSRYFDVLKDSSHRHHRYYKESPKEDGLSHCIEVTVEHYMPWVQHWVLVTARHPERFHEVRYEDLRAEPSATLARVLHFYEIRLCASRIVGIVERVGAKPKSNLRFRKGIVGDWRNHFSGKHVRHFKEACGEFLIELGYEQDIDWTL